MSEYDISNDAIINLAKQLDREETTKFLAGTLFRLLLDREWLRGERDAAHETLRDALKDAPGWPDAALARLMNTDP